MESEVNLQETEEGMRGEEVETVGIVSHADSFERG